MVMMMMMMVIMIIIIINKCQKRSKQYRLNQMFANSKKKFLSNLGKEQAPVEKWPKKEATETLFCNKFENHREHNHSA